MRPSKRAPDELRRVSIERGISKHAEGSCLVRFGDTHVLCTASLAEQVPGWLRGGGKGWVTAEYGMLPRATHDRSRRVRSWVARGSMPYSAVTQPLPPPRSQPGTRSSRLAVHSTCVSPNRTRQEPSAYLE